MPTPPSFQLRPINEGRRRLRGRNRSGKVAGFFSSENRTKGAVEFHDPASVGKSPEIGVFQLKDGELFEMSESELHVLTLEQVSQPKPLRYCYWAPYTKGVVSPGKAFMPSIVQCVLYALPKDCKVIAYSAMPCVLHRQQSSELVSLIAAKVAELIKTDGLTASAATPRPAPAGETDPLSAARARGRDSMRAIMESPANFSLADAAKAAKASQRHINALRKKLHLYALVLDGSKRGYRYPQWQFAVNPRRLEAVLVALANKELSCWAIHEFMCLRHPDLKLPQGTQFSTKRSRSTM